MQDNLTEIIMIIDKSGSMHRNRHDVIGGFNNFLKKQKELSEEATMSVVLFDHTIDHLYTNKPINEIEPLDETTYCPNGLTALLDAVALTINKVGDKLAALKEEERPNKVLVIIMTDGEENYSKEYTLEYVKESITHQTNKYSWEFIFLGANIDAFSISKSMGIKFKNTANYNVYNTADTYAVLNDVATTYRTCGVIDHQQIKKVNDNTI